jgi:hypothetical protein
MNSGTKTPLPQNRMNLIWLILFAVLTIVLWNIPNGKLIFYPFTILGTWFHEMGHGLTAMILGGSFNRLELYQNGSGLAQFSHNFGNIKLGLTAAAGPFGPTIAGAILILASANKKMTQAVLVVLSLIMLASLVIWVRPVFSTGFLVILLLCIIIGYVSIKTNYKTQTIILQFLGVQAFSSVYISIGYLFSKGGIIGNAQYYSDTQVMADNLLLPFWFWGAAIIAFSVIMIYFSFKSAYGFSGKKLIKS